VQHPQDVGVRAERRAIAVHRDRRAVYAAGHGPNERPNQRSCDGPNYRPDNRHRGGAAKLLGLSTEAVRMRVKRGTLASTRVAGTVYVLLSQPNAGPNGQPNGRPNAQPNGEPNERPNDQTALVRSLEDQVAYLRQQLATRDEELRRKDHLLAAALERIPELLPSPDAEPREAPQTTTEDTEGAQEAAGRRSWLYRFCFGP
jgi:hypothetical protein